MIRKINPQTLSQRGGTSQQERNLEALQPAYVQVEGRSIEALVREAQRLAKEMLFFDADNHAVSSWEALLVDNTEEYQKKGETGKEIEQKAWTKQLAAYIEHPESFQNDADKLGKLARPHVVLLMTFLKLLNHVQSEINGLTKKHLDFYFLERLGFTPKEALPDVVNVLFELAANVEQLEVQAGTILVAGTDDEGHALHYQTDRPTVISGAEIAEIKTVFVEKSISTIKDVHVHHQHDQDKGFSRMMEMALGSPNPGDPLPPFPNGVKDLIELSEHLAQQDVAAIAYASQQLCFSPRDDFKDFQFIIQTQLEAQGTGSAAAPQAWEEVYRLLDQAFKNRTKKSRQAKLKELHQSQGAAGWDALLKHVYGSPDAGDDLPLYGGRKASVLDVYADLIAPETNTDPARVDALEKQRREAAAYVADELFLSDNFFKLIQVSQNPQAQPQDLEEVYEMLELANRKVRGLPLLSPVREELFNVYAEADAKASAFRMYGAEEESLRFKTFGGSPAGATEPLNPATIGLAISSPLLLLREGQRKITATLAMDPASGSIEHLQALFAGQGNAPAPFNTFLSTEKHWVQPRNVAFSVGAWLIGEAERVHVGTIAMQVATMTAGDAFDNLDKGKYLVWTDGAIYEIQQVISAHQVAVQKVGSLAPPAQIQLYRRADVYLNALQICIELEDEDLPVVPMDQEAGHTFLQSEFPALVLALNHVLVAQHEKKRYQSHYQRLKQLKMEKVHLKVDVQGIRDVQLQNDRSTLDTKKPFEPFGDAPEVGNGLYLAHPEICQKRLDNLDLELQWMKAPADFEDYYRNYWLIEADDPSLAASAYTVQGNGDFKAKVFLFDKRAELELAGVGLFPHEGRVSIQAIPAQIKAFAPAFQYKTQADSPLGEDVTEGDRYFKLELSPKDFQHAVYRGLFGRQALSDDAAIRKLTFNPPYTPKLKSLKVGYSAHTEILPGASAGSAHDKLYHLHPFGFHCLKAAADPYLLPEYNQEGALYLGIDKLLKPQTLSVLFQMSEGSANPDVEKPLVQWSYLKANEWCPMGPSAILSDTTNGLMNTGIVQLAIPADVTLQNTLLPGHLHWLRVSCDRNTAGIADTIQAVTQAISATFCSQEVAASHFVDLLPPGSITETLAFSPQIKKITQPYTSSKGRPAEKDDAFYNRISERLRHKNRAIAMWDYERMVLEQFPEVYKVKCLPATAEQNASQLGTVNVLVIPDIKGKLPFNPFEPKLPADTLFQIQQFLNQHAPAYAEVAVRNPSYLQVMTKCVVKFRPGYNEGFYKAALIDEIKKFLAPWAYDAGSQITIGGTIYDSAIINFIAERPYVAYVSNMRLFQSEDGKQFTDVRTLNGGKNKVVATRPDTVLVSAQTHEIDIVDENGYDEDHYEGINYMQVELDFVVAHNVLP